MNGMLPHDLSLRLGWTLLNSIWEGAAIAVLLAVAMAALQHASAQMRYCVAFGALGMLTLCVVVTYLCLCAPKSIEPGPGRTDAPRQASVDAGLSVMPMPVELAPPARRSPVERARQQLHALLPYIAMAWALGVIALSLWRLAGWIALGRLRAVSVMSADASIQALFHRLSQRLGVAIPVRLLLSSRIDTLLLMGWMKPVILIPPALLAGLSPLQLENILAHELAHIRRHDYLLNLLQVLLETILFYHPAVWWIGNRIRLEREQCCDDIAVEACGDRCRYVESLTLLEEIRLGNSLALAARGSNRGQLMLRVRRLLQASDESVSINLRALAALTILIALGVAGLRTPSKASDVAPPTTAPTTACAIEEQFLIKCVVAQHNAKGSVSQVDESKVLSRPYFIVTQDNACEMNLDSTSASAPDVQEKQNTRLSVMVSPLADGHLRVSLKYRQTHVVNDGNQTTHDMGVEAVRTVMPDQTIHLDAGDGVDVTATVKPLPKTSATQPAAQSEAPSTQPIAISFDGKIMTLQANSIAVSDLVGGGQTIAVDGQNISIAKAADVKITLTGQTMTVAPGEHATVMTMHGEPEKPATIILQLPPGSSLTRPSAVPPATQPAVTPEVQARVDRQIAMLRTSCEIMSVKRVKLDDDKLGWLINYRQIEDNWGSPRVQTKWIKLGSEGYVAQMSPAEY